LNVKKKLLKFDDDNYQLLKELPERKYATVEYVVANKIVLGLLGKHFLLTLKCL